MKTQVKKIDFSNQNIYCGVDVHKKRWQVTICTEHMVQKSLSFERPFVDKLKHYLDKHYPGGNYYVAYEAGFSGFWPQKALKAAGMEAIVVNPADIPTTDKERKHKNDKRDSRKLALSLRSGELRGIYIPDDTALQHRSMVRERWSIANSERRVKNQIKCHLMFHGMEIPQEMDRSYWSRRFIGWLEQIQKEHSDEALAFKINRLLILRQLQVQATRSLRELAGHERYVKTYRILRSVPGVGLLTAMLLLVEIIDIKRFPRFAELCSYVGFIPTSKSSGEQERYGEMTNRKNNRITSGLVQSSWSAIKSDPELLMKYEHYRKKMGAQKAIVRIAKILLRRIRMVWLTQTPYQKSEF